MNHTRCIECNIDEIWKGEYFVCPKCGVMNLESPAPKPITSLSSCDKERKYREKTQSLFEQMQNFSNTPLSQDTTDSLLEWQRLHRSNPNNSLTSTQLRHFGEYVGNNDIVNRADQIRGWLISSKATVSPSQIQQLQTAFERFLCEIHGLPKKPHIRNYFFVLYKLCQRLQLQHLIPYLTLPKGKESVQANELWYQQLIQQMWTRELQLEYANKYQVCLNERYQEWEQIQHKEEDEKARLLNEFMDQRICLPPEFQQVPPFCIYYCCQCYQPAPYALHGPICCPFCESSIVEKRETQEPSYFTG